MNVDKVVKKETLNMAVGILVFSVITQIFFLIFGKFDLSVLFGSVYGGAVALLNFFLMGLTIQNITKTEDQNMAKKKMQLSYSLRQLVLMLLVGAGMYIAINYKIFHWLPILIAIIYPRLIIMFSKYFRKDLRSERGDAA
ncbi:MAG: hypothetical protein K0S76_1748 [Herbinix sp.]|jgi:hypothetical protein|nr:hypothetical protein [Herbinix sp.]